MATIGTQAAVDRAAMAPSHAAPLPGGEWTVWRSACVRGAGFPAGELQHLAAPASAEAADALAQADERVAELRARRRALRRGEQAQAAALADALREATARAAGARAALERAFAADTARASAYLRAAAGDPRLREAVLWQNRRAVHTAFDPLRRADGGKHASDRGAKERLVASYLQRYCVKNDTIGFFGPVAWARIVDEGPAVRLDPGPRLVGSRAVHFEGWAIDAVARTFDGRPGLRPWVAPRLLPQVRVDRTQLVIPGRDPVTIAPAHARLLRLCDGRRPARAIARELAGDPAAGLARESDVYALLAAFEQMGLAIWSLEVPLERDPERSLREQLNRVGDPGIRVPCLAALDELEACRSGVARAAGDAAALDRAMETLESTFTRLTGTGATRNAGETYGARTLVYEECRRDATIEFGPPLLERLAPPFALLLQSARWCTSEIARHYRGELDTIMRRLLARTGSATADLTAVLAEGFDLGPRNQMPPPIAAVHAELRRRWMAALGIQPGERRVSRSSADLGPRAGEVFPAASPGWTWARHVSPDLMIAADGVDAIARGDYVLVLGEFHLTNTLLQTALACEHPDRTALHGALDTDFPAPIALPVPSREIFTDRTAIGLSPSRAFWYESTREIARGGRDRVLRPADLVVTADARGVRVHSRDGRASFDAIDFLGLFFTFKSATIFGLLPDAAHAPRVTIDGVVVSRERWQAAAGSLEWAAAGTALERFLGARRWARSLGIPRFAFFKVPVERKPCYVDFDSPLYVDVFAKLARKTAASAPPYGPISVTEMLPGPDQLWLVDAEGRRYTSELRLVAVDPRVPCGATVTGERTP